MLRNQNGWQEGHGGQGLGGSFMLKDSKNGEQPLIAQNPDSAWKVPDNLCAIYSPVWFALFCVNVGYTIKTIEITSTIIGRNDRIADNQTRT
jgi:hypothetical protein